MESQAKYDVSKARSSNEHSLAFVFALGLTAHGLFFPAEVIAVTFAMLVLLRSQASKANFHSEPMGVTDALLFGLAGLSLLGLFHSVKAEEAWLEAIRYLLYWLIYRWSLGMSADVPLSRWVRRAGWAALLLAIAGGFPFAYAFGLTTGMAEAGRLNSLLGYANATGIFLAAALLLPGLNPWLRPVLFLALISTGSRSALGLFAVFKVYDLWQGLKGLRCRGGMQAVVEWKQRSFYQALIIGIFAAGLLYVAVGEAFHPALAHLTAWNSFDRSWGERLVYLKDGFALAWRGNLLPQAGGWLAFPLVQDIPYWTLDPHSGIIRVLLNQGLAGLLFLSIWAVLWNRKARHSLRREGWGVRGQELKAYYRVSFFFMLHSLVDADFAFPILGFCFWFLVGSIAGQLRSHEAMLPRVRKLRKRVTWAGALLDAPRSMIHANVLRLVFSTFLVLGVGFFWSRSGSGFPLSQAVVKAGGSETWARVLRYDQTCVSCRRELAEAEFKRGDWQAGLRGVEQVLAWRKFDLSAYEWAQNVVWQAAESRQKDENVDVRQLYAWMEGVPARVNALAEQVPQRERRLWTGYTGFRSTPHLELLARYARERTLQP